MSLTPIGHPGGPIVDDDFSQLCSQLEGRHDYDFHSKFNHVDPLSEMP